MLKLAIECKPYSDETLTSWIIRNSIATGTDPKSFALSVFHANSTWYKDIDRHIDKKQLHQINDVTNLSKQNIIDLTLEPIILKNTDKHLSDPFKWGFIVPIGSKGSIRTSGMYYCPICLKENLYIRKYWKFAWYIACPIHNNLLHLQCKKCNQTFSPHLIRYDFPDICFCTNCRFDLTTAPLDTVSNEALSFQNMLSDIAFEGRTIDSFPLVLFSPIELFLTVEKLLSFLKYAYGHEKFDLLFMELGINKGHIFEKGNNMTFSRLNIKDREFLLISVSRLFKMSLDEIITLFKKLQLNRRTFLKTFIHLSKTVEFIASNLETKKLPKPLRKVYKKIEPKSKEEVDLLFREIEIYIK